MITRLRSLRSTCLQGERKIHVDLETDSPPETAKLTITISGCGSAVEQDVPIGPGNTATFEYQHDCQGRRIVTVQETQAGLETEKSLDLNATHSE